MPAPLSPRSLGQVDTLWAAASQEKLVRDYFSKKTEQAASIAEASATAAGSTVAGSTGGGDSDVESAKAGSDSEDSAKGSMKSRWGGETAGTSRASSHRSTGAKRRRRQATQAKLATWVAQGKIDKATWQSKWIDAPPGVREQLREREMSKMIWSCRDLPEEAPHSSGKDVALDEETL